LILGAFAVPEGFFMPRRCFFLAFLGIHLFATRAKALSPFRVILFGS
jgi:hypothetical protein